MKIKVAHKKRDLRALIEQQDRVIAAQRAQIDGLEAQTTRCALCQKIKLTPWRANEGYICAACLATQRDQWRESAEAAHAQLADLARQEEERTQERDEARKDAGRWNQQANQARAERDLARKEREQAEQKLAAEREVTAPAGQVLAEGGPAGVEAAPAALLAKVVTSCAGVRLLVGGIEVRTWLGTSHEAEARALADQINAAAPAPAAAPLSAEVRALAEEVLRERDGAIKALREEADRHVGPGHVCAPAKSCGVCLALVLLGWGSDPDPRAAGPGGASLVTDEEAAALLAGEGIDPAASYERLRDKVKGAGLGELPADPVVTYKWKCSGCGARTNLDPGCKGYHRPGVECNGLACPGCGKKHYWTGSFWTGPASQVPLAVGDVLPVCECAHWADYGNKDGPQSRRPDGHHITCKVPLAGEDIKAGAAIRIKEDGQIVAHVQSPDVRPSAHCALGAHGSCPGHTLDGRFCPCNCHKVGVAPLAPDELRQRAMDDGPHSGVPQTRADHNDDWSPLGGGRDR